jgi:hypothetical protein
MYRKLCVALIGVLLITGCIPEKDQPAVQPSLQAMVANVSIPQPTITPYIQTFPTPNPDLLLFSVHIEAVRVADDKGDHLANISPEEIYRFINQANQIFAQASIRLLFDPQTDVDIIQSTLIANMLGQGDTIWQGEMDAADQLVYHYPNKIVIFFRENPVFEPTGTGNFFWWDYNFTIVPFNGSIVCGTLDETGLANAVGHFLGLGNTYKREFADLTSAEDAYNKSGYTLSAFDGDDFSDTQPDIFVRQDQYQCGIDTTLPIAKTTITIPRGNLMSGYYPRSALTTMQITRMRYVLALRQRNNMIMPNNRNLKNVFEIENLPIASQFWTTTQVRDMTVFSARNWSAGKDLLVTGGYGSSVTFEFPVEKDGIYNLTLYATHGPDYAIIEVDIEGDTINDNIDLYGPYLYASGPIGLGPYYLTTGPTKITIKAGKANILSKGFNFGLDALTVEPSAQ